MGGSKGVVEVLGGDGTFCILIVVVVTQTYTCTKLA